VKESAPSAAPKPGSAPNTMMIAIDSWPSSPPADYLRLRPGAGAAGRLAQPAHLETGLPAKATLHSMQQTERKRGGNPEVLVSLTVETEAGETFPSGRGCTSRTWTCSSCGRARSSRPLRPGRPGRASRSCNDQRTAGRRHPLSAPGNENGQAPDAEHPDGAASCAPAGSISAVAGILFVPLDSSKTLFSEVDLWKTVPKELGESGVLDGRHSEGARRVPGLRQRPSHPAESRCRTGGRARLGSIEKALVVFGERYWIGAGISRPRSFVEMPLDWAHAYGGPDFAENPQGKGTSSHGRGAAEVLWLPNVESPASPLVRPDQKGRPAGFGPVDAAWPQRRALAGPTGRTG